MKNKFKLTFILSVSAIFFLAIQGCSVYPSLTYDYTPDKNTEETPLTKKIVVMKAVDFRGHPGTTPTYKAYIPFVPYVRFIEEPERYVFLANGYKFDYEEDFARLVAMDLQASGIANYVISSPDSKAISTLETGKEEADYIIRLRLERLDWQAKYSMFGMSFLGYLPQVFGVPNTYGFSYLEFKAEVLDSKGKTIAAKKFSSIESQNGWIYYYSGYLRSLTRAYEKISPEFRNFVAFAIN